MNHYSIQNGIFYCDGHPTIGLGVSYYASFHPYKYQIPPEGDRFGEAKEDFAEIHAAGFNMVRTSALGSIGWDGEKVTYDMTFGDTMLDLLKNENLACMLRLQGYSVSVRQNPDDVMMIDANGEKKKQYSGFNHDCVNDKTVLEDAYTVNQALAGHFRKYDNLVLHLISNEPGYGWSGFFDYHPETVRAYRKWLVERGYKTEEEAAVTEPPHRRPNKDESEADWVHFRVFSTEKISEFLKICSDGAKAGNPAVNTLTCEMPVVIGVGGSRFGEDIFASSDNMDIAGITSYLPCFGDTVWFALEYIDYVESAAAVNGKHAWAAEYNAHTTLSGEEWERETYTMLGGGFKGIVYYQWRADYDNGKGPEIGAFGILHNDRTHTTKYDAMLGMNRLVNRLSEALADSEKVRQPVAILVSKEVNAYYDARENSAYPINRTAVDNFDPDSIIDNFDRNVIYTQKIFTELRKMGVTPCFVRSCDLEKNTLGVKALIIPSVMGLSAAETAQIEAFAGEHLVFSYHPSGLTSGYALHEKSPSPIQIHRHVAQKHRHGHCFRLEDILYLTEIRLPFAVRCEEAILPTNSLVMSTLKGNHGGYIFAITNFDSMERSVSGASIVSADGMIPDGAKAVFYTPDREIELPIVGNRIPLPEITTGCFVRILV